MEATSLRMAVIATSLRLAGAEKQTFYQARALAEAGFAVRFFHLGEAEHFENDLRAAGVHFERIYFPNRPFRILAGITRALLRWQPHIVMAPQFGDLRFAIPAATACRALVVGSIRSDGFYELEQHGRLGRWMFRLAHGVISNSHRARQNLMPQQPGAANICVIPNVIDLRVFDQQSKLPFNAHLPPDRIIVAAVGNLHPCKRFDRFIEALALARRSVPSLLGVIAGADGGTKGMLEAQAAAAGLGPADLVFLGQCRQVPALLAQSAILTLTSEYEGFPNVILEAMAARLPVLTYPAGDAGSIVRHGETGLVVETGETRDLARFLVQLAKDGDLRKKMGEAGRRRVECEYNCEPLAARLKNAIHQFARLHQKHGLCRQLGHAGQLGSLHTGATALTHSRNTRMESLSQPL